MCLIKCYLCRRGVASHQAEVHKEVVGAHKLKMEGPKTDVLAHRGHNDQCRLTMTRLIWQTLRLRMGKNNVQVILCCWF